ncbi:MAG TPA: hypothetical protein VHC86_06845 [Opitutaceae bacterium]|nr:hypothetical protein [Opitutaceae bacterium]
MPPLFTWLLLVFPAAAYGLSRRFSESPGPPWGTAARCAALFIVGLVAAEPFLTHRAVGTGEAYNYSLALEDGLIQLRAGEIPPLAGQTEYAFNGRIHPLRNAPYLFYLAAGLDAATFHRLNAWELQNLSLAFSLVAAAFACYGGLRWGTGCGRTLAFLFAGAYVLSPAVLASAYSANLFMTVHAAAFVPLALAACFRQCRYPSPRADLLLGAALAAVWLAHPPVAFWLTQAVVVIRGLVFLRYPTWRAFAALAGGVVLFAALAAYVLVSVETISTSVGFFNADAKFGPAVMPVLRSAFPSCLLPVSRLPLGASVADFQLGYVGWALAAVLAPLWLRTQRRPRIFWAAGGGLALVAMLLALAIPVPGLTDWLWNHSPKPAQSLTNIWPMQRLYLVALGLVLFSTALAWPRSRPRRRMRRLLAAAAALAAAWTLWEAGAFLARGEAMHRSRRDTATDHLSSNIDLTVTAYSFLGTPPTFVNGVMDPWMELSLLKESGAPAQSNYDTAFRISPVVARGSVGLTPGAPPARIALQPGRRYLLEFDFRAPPREGTLLLTGPSLQRRYYLPEAGSAAGFGMEPGNRRALSIWTAQDRPEEAEIRFEPKPGAAAPAPGGVLADFTLAEVPLGRLPVRLDSLFPFRVTVDASAPNEYVDTPRRWLPGYAAYVNGRRLEPLRSPTWDVMVPVPIGRSVVELKYEGAPAVRRAFWLSAVSWLGFLAWAAGRAVHFDRRRRWRTRLSRAMRWAVRFWPVAVGAAALSAGIRLREMHQAKQAAALAAVGPIRIEFYIPFHETGRIQPLLSTGHAGAGTTVFLSYLSEDKVKVGADIWGTAYESDPLPVDLFRPQSLVVDSSALYPADNPRVQALPAAERERLHGRLRVELNGRTALTVPRPAFDSTLGEIAVGKNAIGSSNIESTFEGEILHVSRLPIARRWILAGSDSLQLRLRLPAGRTGGAEPLFALGPGGRDGCLGVVYSPQGTALLEALRPDGTVAARTSRPLAPGSEHVLEFRVARTGGIGAKPSMNLRIDGVRRFGEAAPRPLEAPEELAVGASPSPIEGVSARFTGPLLQIENPAPVPALPAQGYGAVRLIVFLPQGRTARQEPLLTTGRTGKGDFVYVVYLDARHIKLGYDHWGVSGGLSDPIPVDYSAPHAFGISLGSLYPPEGDPAWGRIPADEQRRLRSEMRITLDGREVYSAHFMAHPSTPAQVVAGLNPIGGSSCDPQFLGVLYSARRLELPAGRP